jgi:hypothetical protein
MARTKTRATAQALAKTVGRGWMIFNDKLADGTRSLKVWGWTVDDYAQAKAMLEVWGCKATLVEKVKYDARGGRNYTMRRLHVQE